LQTKSKDTDIKKSEHLESISNFVITVKFTVFTVNFPIFLQILNKTNPGIIIKPDPNMGLRRIQNADKKNDLRA
jgi:hypothetical protein